MLSIQSSLVDDEKSLEYFQGARTRIQSMALVHEHLYESPSLARIDIDHAIPLGMVVNELLSNALKYAYGGGEGEVAENGADMPPEQLGGTVRFEDNEPGLRVLFEFPLP